MLERQSFVEAFDRNGVRGVLAVANGDLAPLHARWGDTTLLGHLIGRDGTRFGRLSHAGLTELSLGVHELVAVIEAPSSAVEFRRLLEAASVSDSQVNELARAAALHGRLHILRQSIDLGADPARDGSILDDLAARLRPAPPDSTADYAEVVRLLVAAGDRPYLPGSLAVIQFRLPDVEPVTLADGSGPLQPLKSCRRCSRSLLNIALSLGASIDVIAELIDRSGGRLPEDAVMTLVFRGRWPACCAVRRGSRGLRASGPRSRGITASRAQSSHGMSTASCGQRNSKPAASAGFLSKSSRSPMW